MIINFKYTVAVYSSEDLKILAVKTDGKRTQKEMKEFISNFVTSGKIKLLKTFSGNKELNVNGMVTPLDMLSSVWLANEIEGVCANVYCAEYETVTE